MSSIDFDPAIKLCLKYLHSSAPDSTEQLRLTLDDHIRQSFSSAKTLGNVLPKKYLNEEKMESSRSKHKSEKTVPKMVPVPETSPQQLQIPERENDDGMDGELAFDLLEEDLTCVVCRQIAVQAGNRLVECELCHSLYHQDCHKPVISDNDIGSGWQCATCLSAQAFASGFSSKASSPKSPSHISGTSTPVKMSSSSSASSSPKIVTPNINIITGDKRLQVTKKKSKHSDKGKKSSK